MDQIRIDSFNEHRALLFGVAWRMLGNAADAEDILQEAFIRWQRTGEADVRSPRAFLVTIVTRLCLNHLDLARVKQERLLGTALSLEQLPATETNPADDADLADALDAAFAVMLRCLSPIERAVFLLREVFDRDYGEVARIVEKSEDNCRQILRRARERIAGQEPRFEVSLELQETVLREFLAASNSGDVNRLSDVLVGDVTLIRDGSNLGAVAPPVILGANAVSQHLISEVRQCLSGCLRVQMATLKAVPFLLMYSEGRLQNALALVVREGKIQTIFQINCPVRLRSLSAQCPAIRE